MLGWLSEPGGARFLLEAPQPLGIVRDGGRQDLDRHVAPEPRVPRAIDLAHPALADGRDHFVRTKSRAGGEGHGWWPL